MKTVMTCEACPEQYDVYDDDGHVVGYIRLRSGIFRVQCPHAGGDTVLERHFIGGEDFFPNTVERRSWIAEALWAIQGWMSKNPGVYGPDVV